MQKKFFYQARDKAGGLRQGAVEAESLQEAVKQLKLAGLLVVQLKPWRRKHPVLSWLYMLQHRRYVMLLCRQLAVTIGAGMTVSEALNLLAGQETQPQEREMLLGLAKRIEGGSTLTTALQENEAYFSAAVCYMVQVGERSGRLAELLARLADELEKEDAAREKLLTLLLYPLLLVVVTLSTVAFILRFVLPVFASFFQELHAELPWPTRFLLALSDWLLAYGLLLLPAAGVIVTVALLAWQQEGIRFKAEKLVCHLPVAGRMLVHTELARFAGNLGLLLQGGVLLDEALEILQEITPGIILRRGLRQACEEIRQGGRLSYALQKLELFPPLLLGLLQAGEETGTLDESLTHLAQFAGREADNAAERLKVLLEPLLVLVLGAVVGGVVLAIALPILDAMSLLSL